ncbi:MAG: nucleoside phosphorylase [Clostridiales bacterium]|nr:nucleoside phosphorylase [Clostridiales bacterium]
MKQKEIALLEFDKNLTAKMRPEDFSTSPKGLPERCVIAFSHTSVEEIAKKYGAPVISQITSCTCTIPIYDLDMCGTRIALTAGLLGSSGIAVQIEELVSGGVKKIIACGSAGTLTPNPLGALVIPNAAVRDEGASFHYAPPSYEIQADAEVVEHITDTLSELGLPHITGKTWTTDAFYRETEEKVHLRRMQSCVTVEMECSAMIAVARFRGAKFGQIFYCGDDLSGDGYDSRNFHEAKEVRRNLIEYALMCVKDL